MQRMVWCVTWLGLAGGLAWGVALSLSAKPAVADAPRLSADELSQRFLQEFVMSEFVEITPGKKVPTRPGEKSKGEYPTSFLMGSNGGPANEQPAHEVKITHTFRIAKGEVPQHLYAVVMGDNPSQWKGPRNSAEKFTFADALEFCRRLTNILRDAKLIGSDDEIRLPTEAEWEYCCRAGTTTAYSFGDSAVKSDDAGVKASLLDEFGWHTGNAAGNDPPVGAKKPNPWGLYDMHGYLWEFVADRWHDDYSSAPSDGSAWMTGELKTPHVLRGGSWKDRYEHHQSTTRRPVQEDQRDDAIGFRCVLAKRAN
ncbi:MAG: formylglycine-generating enzyme family protein [Planctomycetaceae bacterium]|nr:formylglycine-generating enzyme family protein [Planctomycetaceae bacterium]